MSNIENDRLNSSTEQATDSDSSGVSRRRFLGGLGGAAAATMASGVIGMGSLANAATESSATANAVKAVTPSDIRRKAAWQMRKNMGDYWWGQGNVAHVTNGDEQRYDTRIGNYSKGLPHNSFGEVNPAAYNRLLTAIQSGKRRTGAPSDSPRRPPADQPAVGVAFDLEGVDGQAMAVAAPPALASREIAGEIVEHYWMALLRDTNFARLRHVAAGRGGRAPT